MRSFEAGVAGAVEKPDAQLQGFLGIPTHILAPVPRQARGSEQRAKNKLYSKTDEKVAQHVRAICVALISKKQLLFFRNETEKVFM